MLKNLRYRNSCCEKMTGTPRIITVLLTAILWLGGAAGIAGTAAQRPTIGVLWQIDTNSFKGWDGDGAVIPVVNVAQEMAMEAGYQPSDGGPTPDPAPDPEPTPDPGPVEPTPPIADGVKWQLGINRFDEWSGEDALINLAYRLGSDVTPAQFDRETQTLLAGGGDIGLGIIRYGAVYNKEPYIGDYIYEWEGAGRLKRKFAGADGPVTLETPTRMRETYDGNVRAGYVGLDAAGIGAGGMRNLRIYRAEHEKLFKAGQIFTPKFLDYAGQYKIIRTMDWLGSSAPQTSIDQFSVLDDMFWDNGVPLEAHFILAREADVELWLNAPARLGAPAGLNDTLATMQSQPARVDLIAAAFDAIDASPEWDKYARAVVAAMAAQAYPAGKHFYLEIGNETWHWGGGFSYGTEWFWALTRALKERTGSVYPANPSRGAYGYFSARLGEAMAKALAEAGRSDQEWTMVIGSQTAWDDQSRGPLQGVKDYQGGAYAQPMSRFGVATTGYYRGLFHDTGAGLFGAGIRGAEWRAEWVRRFNDDPEALARYLYDFMIAAAPRQQNIAWVVDQSKKHAAIAADFGAYFLGQYEGSSHDTLDRELAKNPQYVTFYKDFYQGARGAEIIRLHHKRMSEEFPDVVLSDYQHWSFQGMQDDRPWIENTPWGDVTEAEKALFKILEAE